MTKDEGRMTLDEGRRTMNDNGGEGCLLNLRNLKSINYRWLILI